MKTIVLLFLLLANVGWTQNAKPTDNESVINLSIADMDGKPLETKLYFSSAQKKYSFQTDTKGFSRIVVKAGENYRITIPNSDMYYDYEIADFAGQVLKLSLKFHLVEGANVQNMASDQKALLILNTFNLPKGKEVKLIDEATQATYAVIRQDTFRIQLPLNSKYRLEMDGYSLRNNSITVDSKPLNTLYYVLYISSANRADLMQAHNEAYFNVIYTDIYTKQPAPNEWVMLESQKGDRILKGKTNPNGTFLFVVPLDDSYSVHISLAKNIISTRVGHDKGTLYVYNCGILYPSTQELLAQKKSDSLRLAERDRKYKTSFAKENINDLNGLSKEVMKESDLAKVKLKTDPNYFKNSNNVICTVLERLKTKWVSKMIVTDLTGSMYPHMKELLLWHSLKMMTHEKNYYVFFNDGDHKADQDKVIGQTGGLYYTDSDQTDSIIAKMQETMKNGYGGDGPENDIEALIYAKGKKKPFAELLLIADNFSPIKDISLIEKLQVPVHIILCGTAWGINADYVELAYKTKGSIHTIEEDIMSIGNLVDGNTLTIGNQTFLFSKGKFFERR